MFNQVIIDNQLETNTTSISDQLQQPVSWWIWAKSSNCEALTLHRLRWWQHDGDFVINRIQQQLKMAWTSRVLARVGWGAGRFGPSKWFLNGTILTTGFWKWQTIQNRISGRSVDTNVHLNLNKDILNSIQYLKTLFNVLHFQLIII